MSLSRRRFLQGGAVVAAAGGLAVCADAFFVEPNHPVLNRVDIHLSRLPDAFDGFTIAQLSDFHYDPDFSAKPIQISVEMVNQLHADLVVLTGDFVTTPFFAHRLHRNLQKAADEAEPCAALLNKIKSKLGVMTVIGNHDGNCGAERVRAILRSQGLPVMFDVSQPIERDGKKLWIAGLDDNPDESDLTAALKKVPPDEPVVALIHEPDTADFVSKYPVDLQLSGHSHGGQVRLPLIGPVYLPELARKYPSGLRKVGGLTLYTNIGIGTMGVPVRWNCPPEVTLFTLRAGPVS